jgi:hypothetical protein
MAWKVGAQASLMDTDLSKSRNCKNRKPKLGPQPGKDTDFTNSGPEGPGGMTNDEPEPRAGNQMTKEVRRPKGNAQACVWATNLRRLRMGRSRRVVATRVRFGARLMFEYCCARGRAHSATAWLRLRILDWSLNVAAIHCLSSKLGRIRPRFQARS